MDTKNIMVIVKGKIKTSEIQSCEYNSDTNRWDIEFNNGKTYSYKNSDIEILSNPEVLNPNLYHIRREEREFFGVTSIYMFKGLRDSYWHICFENGSERSYCESDLIISRSSSNSSQSAKVLEYIKEIANLSSIKNEETGDNLLVRRFEKLAFVRGDTILAKYLIPSPQQAKSSNNEYIPIFPFGCNNSQYNAVKNAMENRISIIEGPPGTGKTQTILNIIANILMQGKTVQIVSNNNSATENVYEKLSSPKYDLGFIAAILGNNENKKNFVERQGSSYPNFSSWKIHKDSEESLTKVLEMSERLKKLFNHQETLACLKQELSELDTEWKHFSQYLKKMDIKIEDINVGKSLSPSSCYILWQEMESVLEGKKRINFFLKIKNLFKYGIGNWSFYKRDPSKIVAILQMMYYDIKRSELETKISQIEETLKKTDKNLIENLCAQSMAILKDKLARKYISKKTRKRFDQESLWKAPYEFLEEYPVILSTTFSSRSSLNSNVIYDYLIMDEASQVDIATGALSLSCARNAVIVGDTKQLPNVVTQDIKKKAEEIFNRFDINQGYQYTKSFLQSVMDIFPSVARTMLREHYRCHPKIINFCNQRFYDGKLLVMTEDHGEKDVLSVIKTAIGNHARDHYSQRQIDVIKKEILPNYSLDPKKTGIIAPYKNHVDALCKEITDIDIATVHKFQGREKDNIIISTVDDKISDFVDNPYLINVAISRAKKKLILVTTGNEQEKERNIMDLIDYIQYNNFEVCHSKIFSVFDYLYKPRMKEKEEYLKKTVKISDYDSENLMYKLIVEILKEKNDSSLSVIVRYKMNLLLNNTELLNEEELKYALNPATHIDFLIYNEITKKPVLAIEVDGYRYHKENVEQASRDLLKNHILELYEIPLLRCKTNGSEEREKIIELLNK